MKDKLFRGLSCFLVLGAVGRFWAIWYRRGDNAVTDMSAAEALFDEILKGGYSRIARFCEERQEEGLHLDFKKKHDPTTGAHTGDDARNYSKALSGFANSDGGVIVWGVRCQSSSTGEPDVATELAPIKGHRAFMTNLNSLASQMVSRTIDGLRNEIVDAPTDTDAGFVVSLIPASDYAPHCAEATGIRGRYFKRSVSSFIPMMHYELEDMFGRRQRAVLSAESQVHVSGRVGNHVREIRFELSIRNSGRYLAQYVAVHITDWPDASQEPTNGWHGPRGMIALEGGHVLHPTLRLVAVTGRMSLDTPRVLRPFRIVGTLLSANARPAPFTIDYSRDRLDAALAPDRLPNWAWREGVPVVP